MNRGYLSEYFEGVGVKTLSTVDATARSNQHEIGTTVPMRKFLGESKERFEVNYIWLSDEQETISDHGWATHYNSREGKPRAAEYRLYYPSNAVTQIMSEDDTLFLAIRPDKTILFIVVPAESTIQNQLLWLFGMQEQPKLKFSVQDFEQDTEEKLDFIARYILDEIGIEFEDPDANSIDTIIERFGMMFPKTAEFSKQARLTLPSVDARDDPDAALMAWLNHEEAMFRRLEKKIVADRIAQGFMDGDGVDVDGFIKYSLRVQNRRKSRMGLSFQNQLKAVFDAFELRYDDQVKTEKGKIPDFIFPGETEYNDQQFCVELLTMLAAKSTCKDRWPQILSEAERLDQKHLVTLEPGISTAQTTMMQESGVQLIVPETIHASYQSSQREYLWKVSDFISVLDNKQTKLKIA